MNIRGAPDLGQPSDDLSSGGERERIRQRMKMVIGQLEGILRELKEVAKELREVSEGPDGPWPPFPGPGTRNALTHMCLSVSVHTKLCAHVSLCCMPPPLSPFLKPTLLKISPSPKAVGGPGTAETAWTACHGCVLTG